MDEILKHPGQRVLHAAAEKLLPVSERLQAAYAAAAERIGPFRALVQRQLLVVNTDALRQGVTPLKFLGLSGVIGAVALVTTLYTPGYVVSVNGQEVGAVRQPEAFEQSIQRVEARAGGILGYDYTLDQAVDYRFGLIPRGELAASASFDSGLFSMVDEVTQGYVLKVNGQAVGAMESAQMIEGILEELKAAYITENTTSAGFTANVAISQEYLPTGSMAQRGDILAQLTANQNGETVYEVQEGDTFMAIAYANGMSMAEMEALNPGVDIQKILIGQLLNVKEEIPFLSVRTTENVTYTESIPCPVVEQPDESMFQGETRVLDAGVEGQSQVNADVVYVNGKEVERSILSTTTLAEPTNKVVAVGTKVRPSWYPNGYFIWPVYGRITSSFGYRSIFGSYSYHGGIDIAAGYGTGIAAADGGTVVFAGTASGSMWSYGNLVIIDHGNGKQTYYGHCSSVLVRTGDHVYQGQTIARVGSTGRSTGNHCHFEVKINGTSVNPLKYL